MDSSVLIVEDDISLREVVGTALSARGFEVHAAADARSGLACASEAEPDVVILDLGLPDLDGIEVCRRLRRWYGGSIVVLSADDDEARKVAALDEGADDYVTKPFSMVELLARVRVGVRHARGAMGPVNQPIEVGDVRIDPSAHSVSIAGRHVELAAKELAILTRLALERGALITHAQIFEAAWPDPSEGRVPALRVHVTRLRTKLGRGPDRPQILSEYGLGYRLLPPEG